MSTTGSVVLSPITVDTTLSSQSLATAAALAVALGANQRAILDATLFFSLPANNGGVALNWLVPSRLDTGAWPFARVRDDWTVTELGTDPAPAAFYTPGINDPQHGDVVVLARPDARARIIKVRGTALFQAPAGGGTINVQGALAGAGASIVLQAGSHVEGRLY